MCADHTAGDGDPAFAPSDTAGLGRTGIQRLCPGLAGENYTITSPPDPAYNCVAYAAGVTDDWWSQAGIYPWPNAPRTPDIGSLISVFRGQGYELCADADAGVADGYEKVALYAANGLWTHAARQLPGGQWSSKLGVYEDISHQSPQALAGDAYGAVHCIMRRKLPGGG